MLETIARPKGHRWPSKLDALDWADTVAVLDHASDGSVLRPDGRDFSWLSRIDRDDIQSEIDEDVLRGIMEMV